MPIASSPTVADPTLSPAPARAAAAEVDVAVVGAGAAGLFTALCAAGAGARVALVSRSPLAASASYWAQGGVAAALADDDSPARHAADTLAAGRGTARPSAVEALCAEAADRVRELEALGVRFDTEPDGARALALEGGHSRRRVVHAGGSATGRRITRHLSSLAEQSERIQVIEETTVAGLLVENGRCVGLHAEPSRRRGAAATAGSTIDVRARGVVLATGGAAALWERTTNPPGAIGAGLTLAAAAGAALADLELVQFHPTALVSGNGHDGLLLTEALRGEGALLLNAAGERFVDELAPRDEVALAIAGELHEHGMPGVVLDLRPVDLGRFPSIVEALEHAGLDPRAAPVPVAPAAHYTMGGVATDLGGRSSLPGLLAVGECACTGLHGANRLASNSLAECLVFGRRAAEAALAEPAPPAPLRAGRGPGAADASELGSGGPASPVPAPATRRALWRHAGLERSEEGLRALTGDPHPLARSIAACALARAESRGAHRRRDHPEVDRALDGRHFVVPPGGEPAAERWD
jgi:L-aspartate oxidase